MQAAQATVAEERRSRISIKPLLKILHTLWPIRGWLTPKAYCPADGGIPREDYPKANIAAVMRWTRTPPEPIPALLASNRGYLSTNRRGLANIR